MGNLSARRIVFAIVFSACTVTYPRQNVCRESDDDPIFGLICHDASSIEHIADLLASSGYSRLPGERAAFLIAGTGNSLDWMPWPDSRGFSEATYRGSVPARCLAIVHTHPLALPETSAGDANEARRLSVPIVAVTTSTFAIVWPDGQASLVRLGADGWLQPLSRARPPRIAVR
jgi:hypothetical protein